MEKHARFFSFFPFNMLYHGLIHDCLRYRGPSLICIHAGIGNGVFNRITDRTCFG